MDKIDLVPIKDFLGMKFFIPSYQRGYRWTEQQVIDLLEDINEFIDNKQNSIYCIQPLVVKGIPSNNAVYDILSLYANNVTPRLDEIREKLKIEKWEVIDGQQRLTTIKILLSFLNYENYEIEYETRVKDGSSNEIIKKYIGSSEFLAGICLDSYSCGECKVKAKDVAMSNIDFYYMKKTYDIIEKWFERKSIDERNEFANALEDKVQFIWYETEENEPIKIFTRLNIGKIALTDAELIKALFLNQSNFKYENQDSVRLQQIEIANEWDRIEYALQNDEFWLFIHNIDYYKPTRIDFIFDLIRQQDSDFKLKQILKEEYNSKIGDDEHKTFRYFYQYFKYYKDDIDTDWLRRMWLTVKNYFQIFNEWYNNIELYHYIGYLIECGTQIRTLVDMYKKSHNKTEFVSNLKQEIIKTLSRCRDLNKTYGEYGENKRECFPLLLLYNIQYVIDQNNELAKSEKYGMGAFYKFPFHLFKRESKKKNGKGWEVEHIASNSGDNLDTPENQKMWLSSVLYYLNEGDLKNKIEEFLNLPNPEDFSSIKDSVEKLDINPIKGSDKQKIWNFALLDSSTNEEYQNNPFPIKRICVIAKEQGYKAKAVFNPQKNRMEFDKSEHAIAFVPPCTKNVFMKSYTDVPSSLSAWSLNDAEAYLKNIEKTLMFFLYPDLHKKISFLQTPALKDRIICEIPQEVLERYIRFITTFSIKQNEK